jgi:hypothetical protein
MSSTNINSINLGPIWLQSGLGNPDHFATIGTSYTNLNTGIEFINIGLDNWSEQMSVSSFTGGTGGISGSGTTNTLSRFNTPTSIINSHITDNNTEVFIDSNLEINSANTISIGLNFVCVDNDILSGGTY